jgi:nicotinate phosphoribosyltransferase
MAPPPTWVSDDNAALLIDLYELTMVQAYWREEMHDEASFSFYVRRLPAQRNFLLACGLDDALHYLEQLHFNKESLDYLATLPRFTDSFLEWLAKLRFTGDVYAVAEGTPVFAHEPMLEVVAPLPQAQLAETFVMNQVQLQTMAASKAARVAHAAAGRTVVDFGLRRMHGADAGVKSARGFHIAGVDATSNVLAGQLYGIPVAGTMAHSYIQAHETEEDAFRAFAEQYPETILLVDTYDTLDGVTKVIELSRTLGDDFRVRGVRLDSGDLGALAQETRRRLDEAGLDGVEIFASGGLDEYGIAELLEGGAPIDGFGVGTLMGASADAPYLDCVYKMTSYAGQGQLKLSSEKEILPGRKQIFRLGDGGVSGDILARHDERQPGRPLLEKVMENGKRTAAGHTDLEAARARARTEITALPEAVQGLEPAVPPFPVQISEALRAYQREVAGRVR